MKKTVEKFKNSQLNSMNLIVGGSRSLSSITTNNADDVSDSSSDCTDDCNDSTKWDTDSTSQTDSAQSKD